MIYYNPKVTNST